jgi:Fur family ferric uptake transcriptional regulator
MNAERNVAWREMLKEQIERRGLRLTTQREAIAQVFFELSGHANIEEVYSIVRKRHPSIGHATVYRTLKLFEECGLAEARHFGDGTTRFEPSMGEDHHDHLICTGCKRIIEFENTEIERLQEQVCEAHDFAMTWHKMEIYGVCRSCRDAAT